MRLIPQITEPASETHLFLIVAVTKTRVSHSLKKGQGAIQKKGTWCALSHSKRAHSVCARALCVKDKRGVSNIMWKSTSLFIGTGRLTVEDEFCLILSINYKVGPRGEHGAIIHSVLFCSMIRRLTFCINL